MTGNYKNRLCIILLYNSFVIMHIITLQDLELHSKLRVGLIVLNNPVSHKIQS